MRRAAQFARGVRLQADLATTIGIVLLLALVSGGLDVHAQNMPQASQIHGVPLATPELPLGSVTVRVFRERIGNNVADQAVTLEGPEGTRRATTDAQGRAEFTGLTPGATVRVRATVDGEALESQEFPIATAGGTRVALIAGIAAAAEREATAAAEAAKQPARPGIVTLSNQSRVIIEFQDDNLTVFYILDIVNAARTPIDTGKPLTFTLPADARSASLLEGSSTLGSIRNGNLVVTGPFPPGSTQLQVAFQLVWSGDALQFQQAWPIAMDDVFVGVEKIGALTLSSPQITQQQDGQASGVTFIMGIGPRLNADEPLTIALGGLPNRSTWLRAVGIIVTLLILIAGAVAAATGGQVRDARASTAASQREALFAELVELERRHTGDDLDEAAYRERRAELVVELEQVMTDLERPVTRLRKAPRPGVTV